LGLATIARSDRSPQSRRKGAGKSAPRWYALLWSARFSAGAIRVFAATATADIRNLRFYQRLGFRMDRIERDAFSVARGYPVLEMEGIPLRDRVWLSITRQERCYDEAI
jgi:RimJ/RimL family protein N-acetyltransferase